MITYWISFEDQKTEQWLGTLIVDAADVELDEEGAEAFVARLVESKLAPPIGGKWNVQIQKLPASANIPDEHKGRLITDSTVTAKLGGVMVSRHGAN
jgi:hypothetical protein